MKEYQPLFLLATLICVSVAQISLNCPSDLGWIPSGDRCYKFNSFPRVNFQDATEFCNSDGATLLSVTTEFEHEFIDRYLRDNDEKRTEYWLTSGTLQSNGDVKWDGEKVTSSLAQFSHFNEKFIESLGGFTALRGQAVVYSYQVTEYRWFVTNKNKVHSFICEIGIRDVYKIVEQRRDFDYGLDVESAELAPRGPTFDLEPSDTVILGTTPAVHFDCVAKGTPEPSYSWQFAKQDGDPFIRLVTSARITFTTGRLTITNPSEADGGIYQCMAINPYGTILSSPMILSFGDLGQFSNVAPAPVQGLEYRGAQLECPTITGSPAISYQWYKETFSQFIRPEFQKHTFISKSGKLLFSELAMSDDATYYCVATLTSFGTPGNYEGAYQTKSRTSLGFKLNVNSGSGSNYEPEIQNGFIFTYPPTPMKGGSVQLECFAYGTLELQYSWTRSYLGRDLPLPVGTKFSSNNRILTLEQAELEDRGMYKCTVFGVRTAVTKTTSVELEIAAKPFFTYSLSPQHKDVGSRLIWLCEAQGEPTPTYSWYQNGTRLTSNAAEGRTVSGNSLTITSLEARRDSAMYQCAASNIHGTTFSTAQLRVLEIKPSFEKRPMVKSVSAAIGSNMTLVCDPAAAPAPTYSWSKDGRDLGLTPDLTSGARLRLLLNGNLVIQGVQSSDQGRYSCKVENSLGSAEDYTELTAMEGTSMIAAPQDEKIEVNRSVWLQCEASRGPNIDMVYVWKFQDHEIDYIHEPEYKRGSGGSRGSGWLSISPVSFHNQGIYTCTATTSMDSLSRESYVTVVGPPGEPGGVHVRSTPLSINPGVATPATGTGMTDAEALTTRWLTWVDGEERGGGVATDKYMIQFKTEFDDDFKIYGDGQNNGLIEAYLTRHESSQDLHYYKVENLKAGAGIQFRIRARNVYGLSPPSIPTTMVQIAGAPPSQVVKNIKGGGGSVGDLVILWDPLPRYDHNGDNLRYVVHYRRLDDSNTDDETNWQYSEELPHNEVCTHLPDYTLSRTDFVCKFVTLPGALYFFLPYEAKVMALNDHGDGPLSDAVEVMSAEELPLQAPTEIHGKPYNATALTIHWKPIPNTRESARGKLKGYKINYWDKFRERESDARQNIIELPEGAENLNKGVVIGLNATDWYKFNVQAYNTAGNGPKSSDNEQQTWNRIPSQYPTEVHVYSIDGRGVRVTFRGISTQIREEPLIGYVVQVWELQENILAAREYKFGKMTTGVVRNLTSSKIYNLRVYGYSRAGQGKRSSPAVLFTVGEGQISINQETMEIMNSAIIPKAAFVTLICLIFSFLHLLQNL